MGETTAVLNVSRACIEDFNPIEQLVHSRSTDRIQSEVYTTSNEKQVGEKKTLHFWWDTHAHEHKYAIWVHKLRLFSPEKKKLTAKLQVL